MIETLWKKMVLLIPNISDMPFDQRSLVHQEIPFPRWDRQTYKQTDIKTYRKIRPDGRLFETLVKDNYFMIPSRVDVYSGQPLLLYACRRSITTQQYVISSSWQPPCLTANCVQIAPRVATKRNTNTYYF